MSKNTEQPWLEWPLAAYGKIIRGDETTSEDQVAAAISSEMAARMVACFNACAGVSTGLLSPGAVCAWQRQAARARAAEQKLATAWGELRKIREAIGANTEESTLDEVQRIVSQGEKLFAALNIVEADKDGDGFVCREAMEQIRTAIADTQRHGDA